MQPGHFPLGTIIAERQMTLYDQTSAARLITVRLGAPVAVSFPDGSLPSTSNLEEDFFRCPLEIAGLDHDKKVFAPAGEDAFVALQYALDLIGDLLNDGVRRLGLQNRKRIHPSTRDSWIWHYPVDRGGERS